MATRARKARRFEERLRYDPTAAPQASPKRGGCSSPQARARRPSSSCATTRRRSRRFTSTSFLRRCPKTHGSSTRIWTSFSNSPAPGAARCRPTTFSTRLIRPSTRLIRPSTRLIRPSTRPYTRCNPPTRRHSAGSGARRTR
ncbi:hypothetical protein M885DRAFT_513259 [Pelagophyceae sp. CCMP2097]|nr:hypothetical protein M885DRAFT_513259 [Pelagophyceae sp. CCMP2097]